MTAISLHLETYLSERRAEVNAALERILPSEGSDPKDLVAAMRYSVLAGGKRIRPVLTLAAADTCRDHGAPPRDELAEAAAALELFHTYSLIHDDLPCMDDDDLRRGRPTCHVVYGEATALLAGDTLQTLGFEVLATRPSGRAFAARRAEAVALAAQAIGLEGMAGGQAWDLALTGQTLGTDAPEKLVLVHSKKTGALLRVSVELGAILAGVDAGSREAFARYGAALGLLFQIADDILDATSDAEKLGKTAGKDEKQKKLTYPAVFGLEGAVQERERALAVACAEARALPGDSTLLVALAEYAGRRDR